MKPVNAFFIAGAQRSGTTLLSVVLAKHPAIDIDGNALAFRLISCFGLYKEVLPYNVDHNWAELQQWLVNQDYKGRLAELFTDINFDQQGSANAAIRAAIEQRLQQRGKSVFGDKAPDVEHFIPQLMMLVPEAKIVHVVRDGRASAASKANRAHKTLLLAAQEWVESLTMGLHNQGLMGEERYKLLRYEDLLSAPEATTRELCAFLGLEFDPAMVAETPRENDGNAYVKSAFDTSKIDAFKTQLTTSQRRQTERLQAPLLQRFGYELEFSDSLRLHRPMSMLKRVWLRQRSNAAQLLVAKREGMTNRETRVVKVSLSSRLKTFVYYLAFDFIPKRAFRRLFRKRFVKEVRMPK